MTVRLFDYDAELSRYQEHLHAALGVRPTDSVLDIGCGAGQTTRAAARAATSGTALGVDVSDARLADARRLAREDGLTNVTFVCADAQTHPFPASSFDLGGSRFGTMFFADPLAAFTNIAHALRPGARLVQLVWQASDRQEVTEAMREVFGTEPAPTPGADPFSLAEPSDVEAIMTAAGFTNVALADVREPLYYGPDADSAVDAVRLLRMTQDRLATLDGAGAAAALDKLRNVMAAHQRRGGVFFDSAGWLVTAERV